MSDKIGILIWPYSSNDWKTAKNQIDVQLNYAQNIGFKYVRFGLHLDMAVWLDQRYYDWTRADYTVDQAKKMGITPIMPFAAAFNAEVISQYPALLPAYYEFVDQAIKRYAGQGLIWEGYNEANNGTFWFDKANQADDPMIIKAWTDFDRYIAQEVKLNDPSGLYLTGDFGGTTAEMASKAQTKIAFDDGLLENADAISNHAYQEFTPPEAMLTDNRPDNLSQWLPEPIPFVTTEIGVPTTDVGGWVQHVTEQQQADYLLRTILLSDLMNTPITVLYTLMDHNDGFGIIATDDWLNYRAKPAVAAIKQLFIALDGYQLANRVDSADDDYILCYQNSDQFIKYVGWTTDAAHTVTVDGLTVKLTETPQVFTNLLQLSPLTTGFFDLKNNVYTNAQAINQWCEKSMQALMLNSSMPVINDTTIIAPSGNDRDLYLWLKTLYPALVDQVNRLIDFLRQREHLSELNSGTKITPITVNYPSGLIIDQNYLDNLNNLWSEISLRINQLIQILTENNLLY